MILPRAKRRDDVCSRPGYTLIELLLALGLTVVVVSTIATAIQIYIISLTKQQAMVEQRQVARAILEMIENDLRAGIQYKATDYSGLETLVKTLQTAAMPPTPSAGGAAEEEEPDPVFDEDVVSFRPTLLGSESVVMVDISRLPRMDQYNPLMQSDEDAVQTPSDVKSLAYFVSNDNGGIQSQIEFSQARATGGLYRREIDRAVASFMGETSLLSSPDNYTKLLANEVAEIKFRYFDGSDWQTEWDSEEAGGFPMAIEVEI